MGKCRYKKSHLIGPGEVVDKRRARYKKSNLVGPGGNVDTRRII
jgi:hypothetical protein